ncbi:MAG: oligoendopeptidase F [Candidatus Faecousia sp.]|nr:oligoendopeptidase F [Clostridiales bacterium]MDY6180205.1 oligoendopeptidase F [Candidatus Faecousia sp.]
MEESRKIPLREEIPVKDRWATEDMYPTDEAWEQELATLQEDQQVLAAFAGTLGESAEKLFAYLSSMERVNSKLRLLANYCMRKADEDTRNPVYQAMQGKFMGTAVALHAAVSFETPEIMEISEETLNRFYAECPGLERYHRYLNDLRRRKAHTLSAAEERLLASAGEMAQAPDTIYGAFADADITFPDAVDAEGGKHPLSQGTFVSLEESSDRVLRKSAYENLYHTFGSFRNTAASILNAQNKQLKFFAEARKYDTAFEASLDETQVPTSVYLNLIEAVHRNLDKMHRYVRLRKKLLGVEELHFYDIYTPLLSEVDKKIPFDEAKQTVYDALAPLGEEYRKILKEGFDNRWIDVYQNVGKRSGAYSAGASVHPYVLLNYTGTLDSQFTLAHEMGHALHSYLSNKHQNPVDADYVIFVAEVASTCNEALLMEYLLGKTTDKKERAYLINHFLDQFKGTLYRQTMFAEFELNIGKMAAQGKTLTAEVLCEEYRRLNQLYYGEDIVVDDEIAMEWARIPHFYYNYYVFQYATGYSAAIALSRKILAEGESAVKDYLGFLSGGCSKTPIELLKGAGVDMTGPEPVEQALALFGTLLDEMEALMEA